MNQDALVFLVIFLTISYILFSTVKSLRMKKANTGCSGCSGCDITKNISSNDKLIYPPQQKDCH